MSSKSQSQLGPTKRLGWGKDSGNGWDSIYVVDMRRKRLAESIGLCRVNGTRESQRVESMLLRLDCGSSKYVPRYILKQGITSEKAEFMGEALSLFLERRLSMLFSTNNLVSWIRKQYDGQIPKAWKNGLNAAAVTAFLRKYGDQLGIRRYDVTQTAIWEILDFEGWGADSKLSDSSR